MRPDGLRSRGEALWSALTAEGSLSTPSLLLVGEAARLADRLDDLDLIIGGCGGPDQMTPAAAMAEARLGSAQLARLLIQLAPKANAAEEIEAPAERLQVDDIAARRATRRGSPPDRSIRASE